jgi:class 3 adenylate cyclase
MALPTTQYARSGDLSIAYQVVGDGPIDLLFLPGWISQVEHSWEEPALARFFERLSSFSRLILFDRRGTGLSDTLTGPPTAEDELEDALAVLDAVGSERTAIMAWAAGGATGALLTARHPERVGALVMYAAMVSTTAATDYDWTHTSEQRKRFIDEMVANWGDGSRIATFAPSMDGDPRFKAWLSRMERLAASPGTIRAILEAAGSVDVRGALPTIRVPTLVMHRGEDQAIDIRHSHYVAANVPGARFVELRGIDTLPWIGDYQAVIDEIEEFLTGGRRGSEPQRALLTVMFTDIVGATGHAARLGDSRWRDLLHAHDACIREQLERFGGREVKTIGDSVLAVFDGVPSRGLRCGKAVVEAVHELGIDVRIGMHTGECELIGDDVGGMAVHIAARIASMAAADEVLVSGTVYGTVVGAGLDFEHRGMHTLKGVRGDWPIFVLR